MYLSYIVNIHIGEVACRQKWAMAPAQIKSHIGIYKIKVLKAHLVYNSPSLAQVAGCTASASLQTLKN